MTERIRILFCEQEITIISILTALSMTISTIVLAITGVFGGGGGAGGSASQSKGERVLKKWLNMLAITLKRLKGRLLSHCLLLWEVSLVRF